MHDLIRDMALQIAGAKFLVLEDVPNEEEWGNDVEKVSLMFEYNSKFPNVSPKCPKLSTLLLRGYVNIILDSFFVHLHGLTVLHVDCREFESLPNSVSDLKHLTSLRLNNYDLKCVPSLAKLTALRSSDLSVYSLKEIRHGLEMLVNLKYLNVDSFIMDQEKMPPGILPKLCQLQVLKLPFFLLDVNGEEMVLVARIRPFLDKLVSPLQTTFVLGRKGIDNAIIVQEIVHSISKARGIEGFMAIKIDLEKAYDKLEWGFIRERLLGFKFPMDLVEIIMSCISTVSTSILFNGGMLEPINPSRGIRQRDPLSPYIFILCMEFLGQLIEGKCSKKLWNLVKASRTGPSFFIFSSQMTSCCLLKPIKLIALPSVRTSRKMHWVDWQKVTRPRKEGGLGLQSARGRNSFLLAKLNWRFHSEKETLWARVLRNKYCNLRRPNSVNSDKLPCSRVWKGMRKGQEVFNAGTKWAIGTDSNLSFWTDNWSPQGPIRDLV
ncbi:hypothetical protein SO802_033592 [Lithocarpus litseifolius]|uniref:Reverse transcriptase domain-containing protein n=1 Tax=Lithocarpus litseifolius TaxID=425828 RepID=A0AAW2BG87_9ROSI